MTSTQWHPSNIEFDQGHEPNLRSSDTRTHSGHVSPVYPALPISAQPSRPTASQHAYNPLPHEAMSLAQGSHSMAAYYTSSANNSLSNLSGQENFPMPAQSLHQSQQGVSAHYQSQLIRRFESYQGDAMSPRTDSVPSAQVTPRTGHLHSPLDSPTPPLVSPQGVTSNFAGYLAQSQSSISSEERSNYTLFHPTLSQPPRGVAFAPQASPPIVHPHPSSPLPSPHSSFADAQQITTAVTLGPLASPPPGQFSQAPFFAPVLPGQSGSMHLVNPSGTGASGLSVSAHQSCESLLDPVASPSPSPTASYHPLNDYRRPAGDSEGSAFPTPEFRPASPQTRRASDMIRHDHPYPTVNTALPGPPSPTSTIDQLPSFTATNTACSSPLPQSNYHPQSAMPSPNLIPGVAGFSQPPVYPYTTFPPQQGQNEHMKPAQLISSSIHTPYAGHDSRGLETQNMINKSRPAYAPLPIVGGEYLQNELQHSNPGGPTAKDPSPVSHRGGNKKTKTPTKHKVKGRHFMHGLPVVNRVERKTTTATTSATEGRGLSPTSLVDDLDGLSVAGATLENMTLNDDTSTHSFSTGTTAQDIDPDDASILSEASAKSLQSDNASVRSMSSTAVSADSDTDKKNGKKLKEKRLHACSMCNKRFTRQFNLRSHENTHKNIRPYPCEYCHWAFTRRNDISRHLRTKHRGFPPIITCLDERKSTGNNQWTKKKQSVSTEPSLSATSTAPVVTTQSITSAATATVAALATAASVTAIPSKQHWQTQILL